MIRLFVDHRNDTVNAKDVGISHIQNFTNNNVARFASLNQLIEKERLKKTIGNLELQQSTISTTTTTTTTNSTPTLQTPGTSNSLFSPNQQILQTNTNTNTTISSNTHNTHHQNHHHHHNINLNNPSSVFKILLPVDPIQRKTYEVKTRYITPNPVIIHQDPETISSIPILRGSVRVDLVEEDGRISAKLSSLLSCDAGLEIPLDENQKAMFALKVHDQTKVPVRLKFTITYELRNSALNDRIVEEIYSTPFTVFTKAVKPSKLEEILSANNGRCEVISMKPDWGWCGEETEVWIKGSGFTDATKMMVLFGETASEVTDNHHNVLITTKSPARIMSGPVMVSLVNKEKLKDEVLENLANNVLTFTFRRK